MAEPSGSDGKLKKNSIGLFHIVFFVVAAAAPLTAVVGATPAAFAYGNGPGVPGVFILAGLLYSLFSVGFTAMSRYVRSAGAFYTYITKGLGRPAGFAGALMAIVAYNAVQISIYALFAVFLGSALAPLGAHLPWWSYAMLAIAAVTFCGQRNVSFSGNILGVCMLAEVAILLVLDTAIVVHGGGPDGLTLTSFSPSRVFAPGLGVSLVFVVGSYIGFEATAIFAEEASNPVRTVPRATYLAVGLITSFYALSTWAIVQVYGVANVASAAKLNIQTFYFAKMTSQVGALATQTMNVLLITSLFACVLSFHSTINRYFFALGREGLAWRGLGRVHARHGSPAVAGLVQSAIAVLVVAAFAVAGPDPYAVVFSWLSALAVIGILAVQLLVCCAVIAFFKRAPHGLNLWTRVLAPIISAAGLLACLCLVLSNLSLLAGSHSPMVIALPVLMAFTGLLGTGVALWLRVSKPALYASIGREFER